MRKIVFFTKYTSKGPSSRYRTYQYKFFFDEHFETEYLPFFDDNYIDKIFSNKKVSTLQLIKFSIKRIVQILNLIGSKDLIVIEYELIPYFPAVFEYLFKISGVKYVLDFDDAIFHNYDNSKNKLVTFLLGSKINIISKNAAHIITGSPYLTQFLTQFNENITEIPTSVDVEKYSKNKEHIKNDKVVIGWLGSTTTSKNLLFLTSVINSLKKTFPEIVFRFCGFNDLLLKHFNSENVEFIKWSELNEIKFLNEIDIGIMPLEDNLFNRGKCGFKLIQYMAMGKPTISSPLETNIKINRNNKNLFATTPHEWHDALQSMIIDYEKYRDIGLANIDIIKKHYSVEVNSKVYIKLFKSVM